MTSVERFGLFAPLALIGVSPPPCVPASPRAGKSASGESCPDNPAPRPSPQHEGLGRGLDERVAAEGFVVELDAQAGARGQLEPAVAGLDGPGEERGLLVAGGELDGQRAA